MAHKKRSFDKTKNKSGGVTVRGNASVTARTIVGGDVYITQYIERQIAIVQDPTADLQDQKKAVLELRQIGSTDDAGIEALRALARDEKLADVVRRFASDALGTTDNTQPQLTDVILELAQSPKVQEKAKSAFDLLVKTAKSNSLVKKLTSVTKENTPRKQRKGHK